jgi:hypothetical protein
VSISRWTPEDAGPRLGEAPEFTHVVCVGHAPRLPTSVGMSWRSLRSRLRSPSRCAAVLGRRATPRACGPRSWSGLSALPVVVGRTAGSGGASGACRRSPRPRPPCTRSWRCGWWSGLRTGRGECAPCPSPVVADHLGKRPLGIHDRGHSLKGRPSQPSSGKPTDGSGSRPSRPLRRCRVLKSTAGNGCGASRPASIGLPPSQGRAQPCGIASET